MLIRRTPFTTLPLASAININYCPAHSNLKSRLWSSNHPWPSSISKLQSLNFPSFWYTIFLSKICCRDSFGLGVPFRHVRLSWLNFAAMKSDRSEKIILIFERGLWAFEIGDNRFVNTLVKNSVWPRIRFDDRCSNREGKPKAACAELVVNSFSEEVVVSESCDYENAFSNGDGRILSRGHFDSESAK